MVEAVDIADGVVAEKGAVAGDIAAVEAMEAAVAAVEVAAVEVAAVEAAIVEVAAVEVAAVEAAAVEAAVIVENLPKTGSLAGM